MLQAGSQVDRYVVAHRVGRGGQASVYLVRHHLLGTRHALKVLHSGGPDLRDRLVREGRVQARLDPTYVLPVHDVISVQGAPALILPFVIGCSLDELLLEHNPDEAEAAALFRSICRGVGCAHEAGVVHRDLKPGNVMLEEKRGRVLARVADFGLARATAATPSTKAFDARTTRRGMLMGSPAYAAPEQLVDAASVDHRADLWSLGVLLFELLTNELPFQADTLLALVRCVRAGAYDDRSVPDRWRALVAQLLSLQPDARPQSVGQVLTQLDSILLAAPLTADSPIARVVRRRAADRAASWGPSLAVQAPPGAPLAHGPTIAPGGETVDLPSLHGAATAVPPESHAAPHNLPLSRDAFVGRKAELASLDAIVERGARLVSVIGAGGSGKTRMVLQHAWQQIARWPGGVRFCDLSKARTLQGVSFAVAQALDVPLGAKDPVERLGHAIAGRGRCLLLLDNAEQVQAELASALNRWLDRSTEACFIVTSRALLGIAGEHALPLAPLPTPDAHELFLLRARAAGRDLTADEDARSAIDELITLLDHLPLAIELAAARVRVLSPQQLLARMADRFRVLTSKGGRKDRHATLRATLDWSWDLLDAWEQSTLAQLSVFQGGFDMEAIEHVVQLPPDAPWTLDLVQSLVDKSLVRALDHDRFDLLMSVQDFAAERLASSADPDVVGLAHAIWFADLGRPEAVAALRLHGSAEQRAALARDVHNIAAANRWSVAAQRADLAVPTVFAAWALLERTGPIRLGVELLRQTQQLPDLTVTQQVRLRYQTGWAEQLNGHVDAAMGHYEAAMDLARQHGDRELERESLTNLATLYKVRGRLDDALTCVRRHQTLSIEQGDRAALGLSLGNLGVLLADRGRFDEAREAYEQALQIAVDTQDAHQEGSRVGNLATLLAMNGDLDGAQPLFERALECARELGNRRSQGIVLANLGLLHHQKGRLRMAHECLTESLQLAREVGDRLQQAVGLGYMGALAQSQGDVEAAMHHQGVALELALELGSRQREGVAAGHLGHLHRIAGRNAQARALLDQALDAHRSIGMTYWQASWLVGLALLDAHEGALDRALTRIDEAVALSAAYPVVQADVRAAQARVLLARGELAGAHQAVQSGHELQPPARSVALLGAVSALVWLAAADPSSARTALQAALADPQHSLPGTEMAALLRQVRQGLGEG